jgi:hypothetical protein
MLGFGEGNKHYSIEVRHGSAGNTGPFTGTYEQVMSKAYEEKSKSGVTKVIVRREGREIARLQ